MFCMHAGAMRDVAYAAAVAICRGQSLVSKQIRTPLPPTDGMEQLGHKLF